MKNLIIPVFIFLACGVGYAEELAQVGYNVVAEMEAQIETQIADYQRQLQQEQTTLNQLLMAVEERKANINRLTGGIIALRDILDKEVKEDEE